MTCSVREFHRDLDKGKYEVVREGFSGGGEELDGPGEGLRAKAGSCCSRGRNEGRLTRCVDACYCGRGTRDGEGYLDEGGGIGNRC